MEVFSDEKGRASINRQSMNKSMKWCERGSCSLLIQDSECDSDSFLLMRELRLHRVNYTYSTLFLWEMDDAEHTEVVAAAYPNVYKINTQFCRGDDRNIKVVSIRTNARSYHALYFLNIVDVSY